jgi:hypothetical protein
MAREDHDPDDIRTTRTARRTTSPTDQLDSSEDGSTTASNRNWRGERATRRHRTASLPSSRQEFALWLQYGGWRVVSIAAAVVVILVLGMVVLRGLNRAPLAIATPTAGPAAANQPPLIQSLPTVTPAISSTAAIASQGTGSPGASGGAAKFSVTNTGPEGLFLRPDHNTNSDPIKTLQDGSVVTVIGEDFSGPDRVWKHVRDAEGSEGWAAADYLKPAP